VLASTPSLLRAVLPSASIGWCFDRPRFGAEFVPDFLLAHFNSAGYHWVLVELESPTHPALTQAGRMSGKVTEAMRQIGDWRAWLRENIAYAQRQLGFEGINAEIPAVVIVGRRSELDAKHAARYRELSMTERLSVMTYDRLVESAIDLVDRGTQ